MHNNGHVSEIFSLDKTHRTQVSPLSFIHQGRMDYDLLLQNHWVESGHFNEAPDWRSLLQALIYALQMVILIDCHLARERLQVWWMPNHDGVWRFSNSESVRLEGSPNLRCRNFIFDCIKFPHATTDFECFLAFKCQKALSRQRTDDTDRHNNLPASEAVCTMAIGGSSIVLVDWSISCPSYHCYCELEHSGTEATGPSTRPVCIWYCPNVDSSSTIRLMGANRSLLV